MDFSAMQGICGASLSDVSYSNVGMAVMTNVAKFQQVDNGPELTKAISHLLFAIGVTYPV